MKSFQFPAYLLIIIIYLLPVDVPALQSDNTSSQKTVNQITCNINNGKNLQETYPDSAVYFYQNAIAGNKGKDAGGD